MHTLFNLMSPVQQGIMRFPEWQLVRDGLRRNLGTVIRYHRRNPMAVRSQHFLVRLLGSISIPQSQNVERYCDNVDAIALNLSMSLRMTSAIYPGKIFPGVFYGEGNEEILIAHNEGFNPIEAHRDWMNLCPVKVLRHPRSDLGLNIPDGENTGSESGLAVISINIPMLAVQYRAFRLNEMLYATDKESQRSVMQFIYMYVLPNMLFTHLDIALFNRIDNLAKGAPLGESRKSHTFALSHYDEKVTHIHEGVLLNLSKVGKDFTGILRSVPAVIAKDMDEVMVLPDIAPTRQVLWALVLARLPALSFLFRASKDGPGVRNQSEVNKALRSILFYKSDNIMRSVLPLDIYLDTQDDIERIVQRAKGE